MADFSLAREEAEYLQDRISTFCKGSVLAFLVNQDLDSEELLSSDYIWNHPVFSQLPLNLQSLVLHARNFSESMHGAALLYNLMLAEKGLQQELGERYLELVDKYSKQLNQWSLLIAGKQTELARWDRKAFWQIVEEGNPRISIPTRWFINDWLNLVINGSTIFNPMDNELAKRLILDRECSIKRNRSRLNDARALERWSGAAGTAMLDFRWREVRVIVNDIVMGLRGVTNA